MREIISESLNSEKQKIQENFNMVEDALNTVKRIEDIESEILMKVSELKILKLRLYDNPYIKDKSIIDKLVIEEVALLESCVTELIQAEVLTTIEELTENHIPTECVELEEEIYLMDSPWYEEAEEEIEEVVNRGGLVYIGESKTVSKETVNEIIEEQETKLDAEKAMDASLDDAVKELESSKLVSRSNNRRDTRRRERPKKRVE